MLRGGVFIWQVVDCMLMSATTEMLYRLHHVIVSCMLIACFSHQQPLWAVIQHHITSLFVSSVLPSALSHPSHILACKSSLTPATYRLKLHVSICSAIVHAIPPPTLQPQFPPGLPVALLPDLSWWLLRGWLAWAVTLHCAIGKAHCLACRLSTHELHVQCSRAALTQPHHCIFRIATRPGYDPSGWNSLLNRKSA